MILAQYPKVRLVVYLVGIALTAVGVGATVVAPEVGGVILAGAGTLTAAALATAASNTPKGQ